MPSSARRRLLSTIVLAAIAQTWVCPRVWAQPADSRQVGQPGSGGSSGPAAGAWALYRPALVGGLLALLVLQTGLLAALLVQRRRQSDGRYDAIVSALPDLMFLQTIDGVYLDCHAADPSRLYLFPEQFLGRNMRDVLPPAALRELAPAFARVAGATKPVVVEYDLELSGGTRRFEARLVRSNNNQILTLVRDVTEHAEAAAALRESAERYRLASTAGAVGVWD